MQVIKAGAAKEKVEQLIELVTENKGYLIVQHPQTAKNLKEDHPKIAKQIFTVTDLIEGKLKGKHLPLLYIAGLDEILFSLLNCRFTIGGFSASE